MIELDDKIKKFLKACERRIKANIIINKFILIYLIAMGFINIISIVELFIPIYMDKEIYIGIISIALLALIIVYYARFKPNKKTIALIVDSKGLNERLITSLEFIEDNSDIAAAQKKDTLKQISKFDLKNKLSIDLNKKQLGVLGILIVLFIVINSIPTASKLKAADMRDFKKFNKEVTKKIEKDRKKITTDKNLTENEKEKLAKELEKSLKELEKNKNKLETEKTVDKLEKKLENLESNIKSKEGQKKVKNVRENIALSNDVSRRLESNKQLKDIVKALNNIELTKDLSKKLEHGNEKEIKDSVKDLKNKVKDLSNGEKQKISNTLSNISSKLPEGDLKQALDNAASQLSEGELSEDDLANTLASLSEHAQVSNNCDGSHKPGGT